MGFIEVKFLLIFALKLIVDTRQNRLTGMTNVLSNHKKKIIIIHLKINIFTAAKNQSIFHRRVILNMNNLQAQCDDNRKVEIKNGLSHCFLLVCAYISLFILWCVCVCVCVCSLLIKRHQECSFSIFVSLFCWKPYDKRKHDVIVPENYAIRLIHNREPGDSEDVAKLALAKNKHFFGEIKA